METVFWIAVNIIIIVGVFFLFRSLLTPSRNDAECIEKDREHYNSLFYEKFIFNYFPDDGVDGLTSDEYEKSIRRFLQNEKTSTIRVFRNQYNDLISRIRNRHPQTIDALGEDAIDWQLERAQANFQYTQDELRRRGLDPWT